MGKSYIEDNVKRIKGGTKNGKRRRRKNKHIK